MGFAALNPSYGGSPRRQHGKVLARIALRQGLRPCLGHVGGIDMGARRPAAARLDHALDHGSRPGEHGLDTTVAPIADPALDAMQKCIVLDPDPEATPCTRPRIVTRRILVTLIRPLRLPLPTPR